VGREDGVVSSEVDGLDADGEREGGREWRRGRGVMDWMVGLRETAATGLAVRGSGEGWRCFCCEWLRLRVSTTRGTRRFALVDEGCDGWTGRICSVCATNE
jgi:hypothetical protein